MLERLARWSYRRRWLMVMLWIVALVGLSTLQATAGGDYSSDFSLPGTDSQAAFDLLKARFSERAGETVDVVFQAEQGVQDPEVQSRMEQAFAEFVTVERVESVQSPYSPEGARQIAPSGDIAYATLQLEVFERGEFPIEIVADLKTIAADAETDGLSVELGGNLVLFSEFEEPSGSEFIGLIAAMFILLFTFGSLLAMGLPIMTALFGIGIGLALVMLSANFLNVPDFTPQLASMIGIGVGIDYALFIVTRYRQFLHDGMEPEPAVVASIMTSGRAVIFAGTTVVISLLGILLMGFTFVEGVAVGGAATVLVTMVASVTLLPAVLGFVGKNIDRFHLPHIRKQAKPTEEQMWFRWSRVIQRRPLPALLVGVVVLGALAVPLFSLQLGQADAGTGNVSRTSRRAYDLLSAGFGPGFNGPLLLAAEIGGPEALGDLEALSATINETPGVQAASPPIPNSDGTAAIIQVFPSTSPQDTDTTALVHRLRDDVVPLAMAGTGTDVLVGGVTAGTIDFSEKNAERLPILIGVVIGLSFLLLVVVFRSILVPLKAAVMNLLSIGAAYGVIVAIFQWGWAKDLFGVEATAPIEAWVPMMLFTILFGLSMDYEIFLLSRIREEYVRTRDNGLAVANGLASTARVITAAAAIMISVFLSFVFAFDERAIKLFGLGLASAILVDATIVRMVLVPATMELLGEANWWFPKWLQRFVPRISVEPEPVVGVEARAEV